MVEYISNIAVKTNTLKPQGIIKGNLTVANGVLSGFSSSAYFEVAGGRQDNSEFVVKFTTPSTTPASNMVVAHSEYWESIEIDTSGRVFTYNWSASSSITLIASLSYPQTYYVKSVHSGQQRTYYTSTDGETWTQVANFTDTGIDVSKQFSFRLGNSSISRNTSQYFQGTIDLNESYINVNGSRFWKGMDYYDFQQIGGDEFDGQWIYTKQTIGSGATLAVGDTLTWSMASYLPDNDYNYEVLLEIGFQTGTTSGDWGEMLIYQGSSASGPAIRVGRPRTRASAIQTSSNTIVIPIYASDQSITLKNNNGAGSVSSLGAWARGYRRVGKNGTSSSYIDNLNIGEAHTIGGKFLNSNWVGISHTIFSGTLAQNAGTSVNLTSYLPEDGYRYECMFGITAYTGTTSGNSVAVRIGQDSTYTSNPVACRHFTRTASTMRNAGGMICMLDDRTVYISNVGNATSGTISVYLRGYRRVGTNA